MKFESSVKTIPYPQHSVYGTLSDLRSLAGATEGIADPEVRRHLDSLRLDADSVSLSVDPVGELEFRITEREPERCIKFKSVKSPVGLTMWIQIVPVTDSSCKMRLTVDADVNPFLGAVVSKPLKEGVEKIAGMMAMIPYQSPGDSGKADG